ncbi:MAG TPA: ATP-dependent DNA helicase, partial [Bacteroides sp.]|nr:ATP-dependent DNA helicase [Bacteroides sp.]
LGEIYDRYVKRCKHFGAMDFDDLLLQTNLLFRDHPEILDRYRETFDYLLVDEYQDTNFSQYLIIKKLSEVHRNICVVGDDAQSIYSFRGARIENILNFKNDYPDYRLFKLERNYRSTQTIVKAANSVIRKNRKQISKEVYSDREKGELIRVVRAADDREEGFIVASHISDLRFRMQLEYNDFAVLYRTNAQSRIFEESFRRMNIPYKVFGSLSFYQRKEIKDLLAYFRITVNPRDDESLKRVINYPLRGIGKTTVDRLETYAGKLNTGIWTVLTHLDQVNLGFNRGTLAKLKGFTDLIRGFQEQLHRMEAFDMAYTILKETGILDDLKSDQTPENVSRYENVEELLNGIRDFTDNQENEREMTLADFLQEVTLMTDADMEKDGDLNKVSIMTIHSAKGLEFKHLVIAGVEEELFPSQMSVDNPNELEEERRLFYVALTRAAESAMITYAATRYRWGIQQFCSPSRFIREIAPEFVELPTGFHPLRHPGGAGKEELPEREKFVPESYRKIMQRGKAPGQVSVGGRKLVNVDRVAKDFNPSDTNQIKVGTRVEHPRFGIGEVTAIEGEVSSAKATVSFPIGKKQLLLKFAKLRVLE